jgi:hypothetical protein
MLFIPIDAAELRDVFVGHESGLIDPEYKLSGDYRENLQRLISIKFVNSNAPFSWQRGLLHSLDEAGTPGHILAQKIAGSVPRQTIGILGFPEFDVFGVGFSKLEKGFRWHVAFREWKLDHFKHIDSELAEKQAKIKPIVLEAVEILTLSNSETYSYMILHLSCSNNPTNLSKLRDLNQLHNKALKLLLDEFFEVKESRGSDPFAGVQGLIPKQCRTGALATLIEDEIEDDVIDSGHLSISAVPHQKNLARFKARYSFIGLLVSVQRDQLQKLVTHWPKVEKETLDQLIQARLALSSYSNQWWWPQIMLNGQTQGHYELLQNSFGLKPQLDGLRAEIDDSWDVMIARSSEERLKSARVLNKIALAVATLGLAPLWINIFESPLYGFLALAVSGLISVLLLFKTKS